MTGKFVLIPPEELTLYRGRTVDLHIAVQREGADGPISVTVDHLPDGVQSSPGHLRAGQTVGRCSLATASDARIVAGHEARLVATDSEGHEKSRMLRLTITDAVVMPGTGAAEASKPENLRREAGRLSDRRSRKPGWPPKRPQAG